MTLKRISFLIFFVWMFCSSAFSQQTSHAYSSRKYKKEPMWIRMMDDPQANYFETLKAFRLFWKDRVLPKEPFENEEMEVFEREVGLVKDGESEKEREREEKERRKSRKSGEPDYAAEVRAFKGWMQSVKPWVRADGSIISPAEQQQILDKQNEELKAIELRNGKK